MTITRWCEAGRLPATPKPYGKKITWLISPQALEMLSQVEGQKRFHLKAEKATPVKAHTDFLQGWKTAMSKGLMTGKPFSPHTTEQYERSVAAFLEKHGDLCPKTMQMALMAIPAHQYAKKARLYDSLICFGKFLARKEVLDIGFFEGVRHFKPKRNIPAKRTAVNEEGFQKLLDACESPQERLIVILLSGTGLRASEACALRIRDIDLQEGFLTVQRGKGGKRRPVGLCRTVLEAITDYLNLNERSADHPLLLNRDGKAMARNGLYQRLERLGLKAGVSVHPHALRRAFVTINANKGRSLVILQRSCGHADIKTTMDYCRTSEQEVIEAMKGWD